VTTLDFVLAQRDAVFVVTDADKVRLLAQRRPGPRRMANRAPASRTRFRHGSRQCGVRPSRVVRWARRFAPLAPSRSDPWTARRRYAGSLRVRACACGQSPSLAERHRPAIRPRCSSRSRVPSLR